MYINNSRLLPFPPFFSFPFFLPRSPHLPTLFLSSPQSSPFPHNPNPNPNPNPKMSLPPTMSFSDFPDDVQLNILSFLSPAEISSFACTSRRFASLCSSTSPTFDLWLSICLRRWGSKTLIRNWGLPPSPLLYKILDRWDHLIGFWRRIGNGTSETRTAPLVFFEWGPSFITGSRISPLTEAGGYGIVKIPFLWLGISIHGEPTSFVYSDSGSDSDLVPVTVSFMGSNHFVLEESFYENSRVSDEEVVGLEDSSSPPDRLTFEIYQYFANRTSPGGEKGSRRQRKKKERVRFGRRSRWEAEHFIKIVNYCPTPARPLQGLWKGICESMNLDFYLVTYDDVGGITCRRVGESGEPFSGYSPVFWTSSTTFLESPFSREEQDIYSCRVHLQPLAFNSSNVERGVVSRILCINSSYDLVIPDLSGSSGDPRNVEGRIWEYENGTFGFGFLRNNFIVDLKHITLNGCLLDTVEYCCNGSSS